MSKQYQTTPSQPQSVRPLQQLLASALVLCIAHPAFANLQGGISTTENIVNIIKIGAMTIVGGAAAIYLLWKFVESWRGRADWGEFGLAVGYVALAGASGVIATWAWNLFT